MTRHVLMLICVCLVSTCMPKRQWQGQFINVTYSRFQPEEDFRVKQYIVVAYDFMKLDKHAHVLYHFDIFSNGIEVGALEVCDRSEEDNFGALRDPEVRYYLLAGDSESGYFVNSMRMASRQIHGRYTEPPDYETVKDDVKHILTEL